MNSSDEKRTKEKELIEMMISLYCKAKHSTPHSLCSECQALKGYAFQRIDRCPVMAEKSFCSNCTIHCYQAEMREKIRTVMRFSGPRLMFYYPKVVLQHMISSWAKNKKAKK